MIRFKSLLFFLSVIFCAFLNAQELPPIQNFTPVDYKAENQNWSISQSEDKLIYVANNKGLLEYNGANWSLYPTPNETIMRSVAAIEDKIFTGSYMDFGYWIRNDLGQLDYTSLSEKLGIELVEDEEFWKILNVDSYVIFQSLDRIYIYDVRNDLINTINSSEKITGAYKIGESIYFQRLNKGIYKIENGGDILFMDDAIVKSNEVITIFISDKGLTIITRNNGIYFYDDGILSELDNPVNNRLKNVSVYSAVELSNKSIVLGTIANGLIYIDLKSASPKFEIDQSNGILNNTVLSVFEDVDNNVWLGLDNGLSFINVDSPFLIYKDEKGILGSVYASAIVNDLLYLGTNQGLFYKSMSTDEEFKFIRGTEGQVWSLVVIDNKLFCGHHKGTFLIEGAIGNKVSNVQGTWGIKKLNNSADLLIQGNYDGLYILERFDKNWRLRNKLEGFAHSSRYFEVLDSLIFVSHEYKGVFKINVNNSFTKAKKITLDTALKGANSGLSKYNGSILYAYKKGILKYDSAKDKFEKDSVLSTILTQASYVSGRIITNAKKDEFWIFSNDNLILVSPGELTEVPKLKSIPLTYEERSNVVEYENIINITDQKYLVGTSSGYIVLIVDKIRSEDFEVYLNKIKRGINKDHSVVEDLLNINEKGDFKNNENNFRISFYSPQFNKYLKPSYQFRLLGIYDEWSEWSQESSVFFENLPSGEYTFNVRAKLGNEISTSMASYSFSIAKPWYFTNTMLVVYGLTIVLFLIFIHNVYKRHYHKEQLKLIEKNRREFELAKAQNDKEIMRIKSEKLEKEFKTKSKELAASTMSIVKKNELLAEIKDRLMRVNDKIAFEPVIEVIDKNLNHNDNWEFFKEAFQNADSEFFKTLKDVHPNLSPNDLKLCAYLRLNLSSKEIAPMFNISARSVEIKRYRLRKKMNLSSNENLTNYILSL